MKTYVKPFILGVISMSVLLCTVTAFAESTAYIEAIFGRVSLKVDGMPVEEETLLYNGVTYVPLRAAAEILGKEVKWDEATRMAYIYSPIPVKVEEEAKPDEAENNEENAEEELTSQYSEYSEKRGNDTYLIQKCVFSDGVELALCIKEWKDTPPRSFELELKNKDRLFVMNNKADIYGRYSGSTHSAILNEYDNMGSLEMPDLVTGKTKTIDFASGMKETDFFHCCRAYDAKGGWIRGNVYFDYPVETFIFDDGIHKCEFSVR